MCLAAAIPPGSVRQDFLNSLLQLLESCEMPSSPLNNSCWLPKCRMLQDFCVCAAGSVPPKRVLDNVCPRRAAGTARSSWDQRLLPLVPPAAGPASPICVYPASIVHALPVLPKISLALRVLPWGWPGSFCFCSALLASLAGTHTSSEPPLPTGR